MHQFTQACQFNLCEVEALVDPSHGKPIQKGTVLLTTSPTMHNALHGRMCRRNHEHQPIEGSLCVQGQHVRRSTFTEVYPRKFARLVARVMLGNAREWPFRWSHGMIAMACSDVQEQALVVKNNPILSRSKGPNTFTKYQN